jgi:hypothetical protein
LARFLPAQQQELLLPSPWFGVAVADTHRRLALYLVEGFAGEISLGHNWLF